MRRARARLLASAIVIGVATAAYAMVQVTAPQPRTNLSIKTMQMGRIVFSLRNNGGSPIQVMDWTPMGAPATDGCSSINKPVPLLGPGQPTIPVGGQVQFIATTGGFSTPGDKGCLFEAVTNPAMVPGIQVGVTFVVSDTPSNFDIQPQSIDFGTLATMGAFEAQQMRITNNGATGNIFLEIQSDPDNVFSFDGCGGKSCSVFVPGMGSATGNATVRCTAGSVGGLKSSQIWAYDSPAKGMFLGSAALSCMVGAGPPQIEIEDNTLDIFSAEGVEGQVSTNIIEPAGDATLSYISVSETNFRIDLCGAFMTACSLSTPLPTPVTIYCTPGSVPNQATLYVEEASGDMDMGIVYCNPTQTSMAELTLSTSTMTFGMQPVNTTMMQTLTLTNTGDLPLSNIVISFPTTTHWSATNCTPSNPCSLTNMNDSTTADIRFHPTNHGDKGIMATVSSMETLPQSLNLMGIGTGGVLAITAPPLATPPLTGYHLQLGTIPRGQTQTLPIRVQNQGNATLMAIVGNVNPPYSVVPATLTSVGPNLMTQDFNVTCGSNTPSANNDQVFTVTSPDAYAGASQQVTAHCAIANTLVQVNPLAFDFGELRTNGGPMTKMLTVTLTNPGPANAQLDSMQLRETIQGLTLTPPTTMATLAATEQRTAVMQLTNAADVDIVDQFLDIYVDGEMLALPVTGKVVTASSRIVPQRELDLGTACVGTQISGNVMLINDGTATLAVQPPQMNESFIAMAPATSSLGPSMSLTATVTPAMSAVGQISGKLTWADDVPNNHEIDVRLDYVSSGTALSPRALDFGFVEVGRESELQRIKLQNCDLERATIKVDSLRTKRGPLAAWIIEPQVGYQKILDGGEEQSINVKFVPPGRGVYEAVLTVVTQTGKQTITLRGDATGKDFDVTSFYACACSGPGAPSRGWPVVLAVVLVIARRRRGPSSAR